MGVLEFYLNFVTNQLPVSLSNQCVQVSGLYHLTGQTVVPPQPLLSYTQVPSTPLLEVPDLSLLESLSPENILRCVFALMCEKQMIFLSTDNNRLVLQLECLLSFIQPLQWHGVYIPHLPVRPDSSMWNAMNAVVPFLVGCHSSHQSFIEEHVEKLTTKIIVDLDKDEVYNVDQVIDVPEGLLQRSQQVLTGLVAKWHKSGGYQEGLEIKNFFVTLAMTVLDNYLLFFKKETKSNASLSGCELFDTNRYLGTAP